MYVCIFLSLRNCVFFLLVSGADNQAAGQRKELERERRKKSYEPPLIGWPQQKFLNEGGGKKCFCSERTKETIWLSFLSSKSYFFATPDFKTVWKTFQPMGRCVEQEDLERNGLVVPYRKSCSRIGRSVAFFFFAPLLLSLRKRKGRRESSHLRTSVSDWSNKLNYVHNKHSLFTPSFFALYNFPCFASPSNK